MKLFVWEMICQTEYDGVVLALAETAKEARRLIVDKLDEQLRLSFEEDYCIRKLNYLRGYIAKRKPKIIDSPRHLAIVEWDH